MVKLMCVQRPYTNDIAATVKVKQLGSDYTYAGLYLCRATGRGTGNVATDFDDFFGEVGRGPGTN